MMTMRIRYPIHTLDNRLLFSSGALLTEETLESFVQSCKDYSYRTYPFLSHGSLKKDCLSLLKTQPYANFFSNKEELDTLLNLLERVRVPFPIALTMDYFKRYDFYTYAHILMVFALSTLLAKDLVANYQDYIESSASGSTHDIGKICVPLNILMKPTPLTKMERDFLEHHAVSGFVLLCYYYKDLRHLSCKVALEHHERRDGSGYPQGIILNDPMVEIIAASDVYDALIKPRPYRSTAYESRTALEEIVKMTEQNKIGLDVVKALIAHHRQSRPHYSEITISTEKRGSPPVDNAYGILTEKEKTDPGDRSE
jgi:HD-GYP domain-containing protein (c-di-GMP phosphodiesterase class II)